MNKKIRALLRSKLFLLILSLLISFFVRSLIDFKIDEGDPGFLLIESLRAESAPDAWP